MQPQDRFRGCLLGLATADAVGTTVEFSPPGTFVPLTDMVGGGPFQLQPGQWTDDTSMALCLATSLVETGGFDPTDQMERYVNWYRRGYLSSNGYCFDIGNTVCTALHRFEETGDPYSGSTNPMSAGNGSIMRLAPVAMAYAEDEPTAVQMSADSSRTTHGAKEAIDACRLLAVLLVRALHGANKSDLLHLQARPWPYTPLSPRIEAIRQGSFKEKEPPDIAGTGYVVASLEAALWAFDRSDNFRAGCLLAANLGDDADTTAAVYGQLAGAFYGISGIPAAWRQKVTLHDQIISLADRLWHMSKHNTR